MVTTRDPEAFADPVAKGRYCSVCGKFTAAQYFRSVLTTTCNRCEQKSRITARHQRTRTLLKQVLSQQVVAMARGDKLDTPRISQFCHAVFRIRNGVDAVAQQYSEQLDEAISKHPGSKVVLDQFGALAKLLALSTASMDQYRSLEDLTDEELQSRIDRTVIRIIDAHTAEIESAMDNEAEDESDVMGEEISSAGNG
jgi:hypothetical protein